MTTQRNLRLPEPQFSEHELIRNCAPTPELSAGFKAKVMAECNVSMTSAARAWRWKVATTTAVLCALGLLICLVLPNDTDAPSTVIRKSDAVRESSGSRQGDAVPGPSQMAADVPKAIPKPPRKSPSAKPGASGNQLIDGLNQRKQLFDASMIPTF